MSHSNSASAIIYAFAANLGIALTKTGAAVWTGSGSLLAEAIHSFADCGNQVLLFIGMKRSARAATQHHPMGFGREAYIWSMMVAITLFSVGGLFSIHEGWLRYHEPHTVENAGMALAILAIAVVLEGFSLRAALAAMENERGERGIWQWFKETQSSELMVVIGEDLAALLGLVIAAAMLGLTMLTGNSAYDAVGSMLIGALLVVVAVLIGREVHSLLLGEADVTIRDAVQSYLEKQGCINRVLNIWAVSHGSQVMLAIKAELLADLSVGEAVELINGMEKQIKIDHPRVNWVFFEIDNSD
ncbi:cation diffusion facilitator family transporter [Methylomonas sp. MO1]|uniref:cation diffusion facilitator family transporter n=1 Tax=unclassified Methylomonas TaxID=2608980 RepID=UPI00036199E0|nr:MULTISPECIES: cation diffusion facilitator family transporter [unclassified Methylomonas]MDT4290503.1 cation diffusion facilitator family transporter [Methylomonas sp. MO1]